MSAQFRLPELPVKKKIVLIDKIWAAVTWIHMIYKSAP